MTVSFTCHDVETEILHVNLREGKLNNYEEAKTRTRQTQCAARRMEIPGLSNNTTENLKQKKIIS